MKKILFLVIALVLAFNLFAEEPKKITEIGLTTTRPLYNTYNFTLKYGTEESLVRISSLSMNDYINDRDYVYYSDGDSTISSRLDVDIAFAFAVGREKRKVIDENFEFRYGIDLTFSYSSSTDIEERTMDSTVYYFDKRTTIRPGAKLVLGFNYVIKERFVIGVELLPYIYYSFIKDTDNRETDTEVHYSRDYLYNTFKFNFSTTALFSFSYRF